MLPQVSKYNVTVVTSDRWKAAVPHKFIWFDFMSIPQMGIYRDTDDAQIDDQSFVKAKTREDLKSAVESNPSLHRARTAVSHLVPTPRAPRPS